MAQQLARQGFSRPADAWLYFHRLASSSAASASNTPDRVEADGTRAMLLDAAAEVAAQVPLDAAGCARRLTVGPTNGRAAAAAAARGWLLVPFQRRVAWRGGTWCVLCVMAACSRG
jgi:hypothetical protein